MDAAGESSDMKGGMVLTASTVGGPMNCLMSARSTKAMSMAPVMFEVVRMSTLRCFLILSICVSMALTTRT